MGALGTILIVNNNLLCLFSSHSCSLFRFYSCQLDLMYFMFGLTVLNWLPKKIVSCCVPSTGPVGVGRSDLKPMQNAKLIRFG